MKVEWAAVCRSFWENDTGVAISGVGCTMSQPVPLPAIVEIPVAVSLLDLNESHVVDNLYTYVSGPNGVTSERGKHSFLAEDMDIPPGMRSRKVVEVTCRFLASVGGIYRLGFAAEEQKAPVVVDFYVDGSG